MIKVAPENEHVTWKGTFSQKGSSSDPSIFQGIYVRFRPRIFECWNNSSTVESDLQNLWKKKVDTPSVDEIWANYYNSWIFRDFGQHFDLTFHHHLGWKSFPTGERSRWNSFPALRNLLSLRKPRRLVKISCCTTRFQWWMGKDPTSKKQRVVLNLLWWYCWWKKSGDHHLGCIKPCK